MHGHDVFQGHDPTFTNVPGENNLAALHRGLDSCGTSPVDGIQRQPAPVQRPREHQDLPYLVAIQLHPLETSSPWPRKLLAISRENEPPPVNLGIQHRPTLFNLNRNYTGVPIHVHLCTLNPRMRLQVVLQHVFVESEQAGVVWESVGDFGFGVHTGAFHHDAGDGESEVGDEEEDEGSGGGYSNRDQDGAQRSCQDLDPCSSSIPSRSSPAFEMSPAPRVSTRSPLLETFRSTAGMVSCWG